MTIRSALRDRLASGPLLGGLLALLHAPALQASCPAPVPEAELAMEVAAAEIAYREMDEGRFQGALAAALDRVSCASEVLSPGMAAALHRQVAYGAFLREDRQAVLLAFQAAVAARPGYALPAALAPPGNPLLDLYAQAGALPPAEREPLSAPAGLVLWVDGAPADGVPLEPPAVVQVVDPAGGVRWSGYKPAGERAPEDAGLRPPPVVAVVPLETTPLDPRRGRRVALGLSAAGVALGAAALYGVGALTFNDFNREGGVDDDLDALARVRTLNHAALIGAGGLGALSVGLGVGAALELRW